MALVTAQPGGNFLKRRARSDDHNWERLGTEGQSWLAGYGCTGNIAQCRGIGYSLMVWELTNPEPDRIVRASVAMNTGEVESVIEDDYPGRMARWRKRRDEWMVNHVLPQHGLRVIPKEDTPVSDHENMALEIRDKVFDKVKGKGLREYSERPAPPGHKWVLQRERGKPRGSPFRKGKDARRYQEQSRD